jgi:hypothetical protein
LEVVFFVGSTSRLYHSTVQDRPVRREWRINKKEIDAKLEELYAKMEAYLEETEAW